MSASVFPQSEMQQYCKQVSVMCVSYVEVFNLLDWCDSKL